MNGNKQIFRDKLLQGEMWLQYCPECRRFVYYPRERCPHCWAARLDWQPVTGQATVHSFTIVRVSALPEFTPPYIYALVDLAEGVRMATNIEDCPLELIRVGLPVRLQITNREGCDALPIFVPV